MNVTNSKADQLTIISRKLDVIMGFLATRGMENDQGAMVDRLAKSGFNTKVIAAVSGLTENAVGIRLHRAKKKQSKQGGKE